VTEPDKRLAIERLLNGAAAGGGRPQSADGHKRYIDYRNLRGE
jgi:hypothetical protein